jgi:hypothetical protein
MKIFFETARQPAADLISLFAQGYRPQAASRIPGTKTGHFICPRAIVPEGKDAFSRHKIVPGKIVIPAVILFSSSDQRERAVKRLFSV